MAESSSIGSFFSGLSVVRTEETRATIDALPVSFRELAPLIAELHRVAGVERPSTSLSASQLDLVFQWAGERLGVRPVLLKYIAVVESNMRQKQPSSSPAAGLMQIERSAHPDALRGEFNVDNDTIANVLYGALLGARIDKMLDAQFRGRGVKPPTDVKVRELIGDYAYNRGPAVVPFIVKYALEQGINLNSIDEYLAGRGGRSHFQAGWGGHVHIAPGPGSGVSKTGAGSVLDLALKAVDASNGSITLQKKHRDRNGDGRADRQDILILRSYKYMQFMASAEAR